MFERVSTRAAVRHDAVSSQTQQRRAAVGFVIEALTQPLQGGSEHRRTELGQQVAAQKRIAHHVRKVGKHSFAGLEYDVPDETIRNDHVRDVVEEIAALHVSNEADGRRVQKPRGFKHELIPFASFLADRKYAHPRLRDVQHGSRVGRPHDRELLEPFGLTIDIRPGVEQNGRSVERRPHRRNRGTRDPFNRAQLDQCDRKERAAIARRNNGIGLALFDEIDRDAERGSLARASGRRRREIHGNCPGGVYSADSFGAASTQKRANALFVPD